ncbi:MAG: PQQ-dependent sugar dehydrogenase [Pyrinomonadaceae bacterium]
MNLTVVNSARMSRSVSRPDRRKSEESARRFVCLVSLLLLATVHAHPAHAATLPGGFTETQIGGLSNPTAMAFAPDGRLFVCQQGGQLRVIKNGALLGTSFLTVTVNASGERGLLGVAFDPNFTTNRFLYVYYTATTPTVHNRVSRFTAPAADAVNPDVVLAGSEVALLDLENLSATNHNGGAMHFGSDGKLYIATGENAVPSNSQTLSNKLGKILRLNPDGTIPSDNPFFGTATGTNRSIWALGLRNPFTFSVQPGTGRLFINDVGQGTWEEINDGVAGANYGWPTCEGKCPTPNPNFRDPVIQYSSGAVSECAITGGTFYNPRTAQFPAQYLGKYFFADFCAGWIRYVDPQNLPTDPADAAAVTGFATGTDSPVDLQVAADGSLWYLARGSGSVFRVQFPAGQDAPSITQHPQGMTVAVGEPATFTVGAEGSTPLSYQWQRNNADIPGANASSYTLASAQAADSGAQFRCRVTNAFGNATSNHATLTVTPNTPPTATINTPPDGTLYNFGDVINYSGAGTDAEDGTLAATAFTWRVDFQHDQHFHPHVPSTSGVTGGNFTADFAETAANVWYRIHLTVTDSGGLSHSAFRDVFPRTATVTLRTNPAGLQLTLDGQPRADGYAELNVVNIQRTLGAPLQQTFGGVTYNFTGWSDGGAASHDINVPATATTYTANYTRAASAGDIIISEFRLRGALGAADEYVELYNRADTPVTVSTADGTSGWALARISADGATANTVFVIPAGTTIPARGHFLVANNTDPGGYSLKDYGGTDAVLPDGTFTSDIPDNTGVALFNSIVLSAPNRLDAVGFDTTVGALAALYREGAGMPAVGTLDGEYCLARKLTSGYPQDTGDNAADFQFLSTSAGTFGGTVGSTLGAPGPAGRSSPTQRNATVKASLIEPQQASSSAPNRVRDAGAVGPRASLGTLSVRRRFRNATGQTITRLRFRVVEVTTLGSAGGGVGSGQADLRLVSGGDLVGVGTSLGVLRVRGTLLEQPPTQAGVGGGLNTTVVINLPGELVLPPNGVVEVHFLLGVEKTGRFRFFINVEAVTQ